MSADSMPEIFRLEAERVAEVTMDLTEHEWTLPTACPPWSVGELLSHVRVVIACLPGMLMGERPLRAEVSAADYYRADERFDPETNSRRISLAQAQAVALTSGDAIARDFDATWRRVYREPWLTPEAGASVEKLLLGPAGAARIRRHRWDQVSFLRIATGRDPISAAQAKQFDDLGIRWLALG